MGRQGRLVLAWPIAAARRRGSPATTSLTGTAAGLALDLWPFPGFRHDDECVAGGLKWILRSQAPSHGFACGFSASPTCTRTSILTTITVIARTIRSVLRAPRLWSQRRAGRGPTVYCSTTATSFRARRWGI